MDRFRLHDWNDARLILACADHGSFARAAQALGIDQTTVSRRVTALEALAGRPLFTRRRSGAAPTPAGMVVLERARQMAQAAAEVETALRGLAEMPRPTVTVGASEGLLTYTLIPALLGDAKAELPLDRHLIATPLPNLAFTTHTGQADVAVLATSPGDLPPVRGAVRVRRVGTMHFRPVAARGYFQDRAMPSRFDDLAAHALLDIGFYQALRGLDGWNGLVARDKERGNPVVTVPTTPSLHDPLLRAKGVSLLPDYAALYEPRLVALDLTQPRMEVDLWLVAHEDGLREPEIRSLYDLLGAMFLASPWYRDSPIGSAYTGMQKGTKNGCVGDSRA